MNKQSETRNKVILGLSGGVDSTAAALLLRKKGLEPIGLYFSVRAEDEKGREKAQKTAEQLGIPLICKNLSKTFEQIVISDFCDAYQNGETPNPCVLCNPTIKFRALLETAEEQGAEYIATGHYARVALDTDGFYRIRRAANRRKDQSYMLYALSQEELSRLVLPLGEEEDKQEVRELVRAEGISNADDRDSQEICFLENGEDYISFLEKRGIVSLPGAYTDDAGNPLGRHQGIIRYTVGQRKGLGQTFGKPMFVAEIHPEDNTVILTENQGLFTRHVWVTDVTCANGEMASLDGCLVSAKIRYAGEPADAQMFCEGEFLHLVFQEAQRAVTPGQAAVFYENDRVLGGGRICRKPKKSE